MNFHLIYISVCTPFFLKKNIYLKEGVRVLLFTLKEALKLYLHSTRVNLFVSMGSTRTTVLIAGVPFMKISQGAA